MRGRLWCPAELFVTPGRQAQGIGDELLDHAMHHASKAGAADKCLITFFNVVSKGLHVRHGLFPRMLIDLSDAGREPLAQHAQGSALRTTPVGATAADRDLLRQIDFASLGVSREKHPRYLLSMPAMTGVFLEDGGERVGYAYVAKTGHIGPLAVMDAHAMPGAFRAALALAVARHAEEMSVFVPGTSDAVAIATNHGMRLKLPMVLISARAIAATGHAISRTIRASCEADTDIGTPDGNIGISATGQLWSLSGGNGCRSV